MLNVPDHLLPEIAAGRVTLLRCQGLLMPFFRNEWHDAYQRGAEAPLCELRILEVAFEETPGAGLSEAAREAEAAAMGYLSWSDFLFAWRGRFGVGAAERSCWRIQFRAVNRQSIESGVESPESKDILPQIERAA